MMLVKSLYAVPTWTRTAALVREHDGLQAVLGAVPSLWACYRFAEKLRRYSDLLDSCIARVLAGLHDEIPEMGEHIAIDGSDLPAYANGHRFLRKDGPERERYSDTDASWGHRSAVSTRKGGGFYGYKLHAVVDTATDLPVAWTIATARNSELQYLDQLLDGTLAHGFTPNVAILDKGYDGRLVYEACEKRGMRPIIPIRKNTRGEQPAAAPECKHGTWTFAGSDAKRGASKWRCPTGKCSPASTWIKADRVHPLIPRATTRWKALYRERGAVEREFGRLKHEWALLPLRVRRIERVRLHANLSILARLTVALDKARRSQETHDAPLAA